MSYNILNIGKTGMKAMQNKMDSIADELSNANTHGYKKKNISFQELLINQVYDNEVLLSENATNIGMNAGSRSGVSSIDFTQGRIQPSSREFDLAIEGQGFFGVVDNEGNLMLTRNGNFHLDGNGNIVDSSGNYLDLDIIVPVDQWGDGEVTIRGNGEIMGEVEGGEDILLARIAMYNPEVLNSLIPLGEGRYLPSPEIGLNNSLDSIEGFGNIIQYALEDSNVEITNSMIDMIMTQRAYSLNGKGIETTDDIMDMINNIKR